MRTHTRGCISPTVYGAYRFHNLRVVCQDHAAAAFLRRPFQRPAQRRFVAIRAAQRVQDMYVVIISWTGIRNVAG